MSMNQKKREYWEKHIKGWRESGLKKEEYCNRYHLKHSTFCYWQWVLNKRNAQPKRDFIPIRAVQSSPVISNAPIEIKLRNGTVVHLPLSMDVNTLGRLLQVLGE